MKEKRRKKSIDLFYSVLFSSFQFDSILFYSILFYSILFYSILFCSILFYSILFYSILFYSILFYSILFYSLLFYSVSGSCDVTAVNDVIGASTINTQPTCIDVASNDIGTGLTISSVSNVS